MSKIEGKTALVTGGASGIGLLLGRRLLEEGAARLIIWDIDPEALGLEVRALTDDGRSVTGMQVDVTDTNALKEACDALHAQGVDVDILVNNAGIVVGKEFIDHAASDIARTMAVNSVGPMQLTAMLLPGMLRRDAGHIVNIASAAGLVSNPDMSVYCASKWAMIGWSDSLRLELERARTGVRVTTVVPYYIDTGMFEGVRSPLIPLLRPDYVVGRMVRAIRKDKIFLRMPRLMNIVPLLKGIMPTRWFDRVGGRWFGVYRSMETFRGRD
jgi:all-trans-retinol dehydrogenase (NAD+)